MSSVRSIGRRTADLLRRAMPERPSASLDLAIRRPPRPTGRPNGAPGRTEGPLDRVPETVVVDDLVFHIDPRNGPIGPALAAGQFQPTVLGTLRNVLSPGETFVDVGASFGYLSTQIGRHLGPRGSVVAFEPGRQHHSLLLLNLIANGVLSADVHPIALTNRPGLLWYRGLGADGVISPFDGNALGLTHHDLVQSSTLDRELGGRTVHGIRIDVAGAEGLVLLGARGVLRSSAPVLLIHFDPTALSAVSKMSGADVLDLLNGLGYLVGIVEDAERRPDALSPELIAARSEGAGLPLDLMAWSALRE
jgi:FkbM family methyltransferase